MSACIKSVLQQGWQVKVLISARRWPLLILVPASLCRACAEELPKWLLDFKCQTARCLHCARQGLSDMARLQDKWPLLVVVPASLRLAWAEEMGKWLPHVRPSQVHVIEGRTDRLSSSELPQVQLKQ